MKKTLFFAIILSLVVLFSSAVMAGQPCATIQSGTITDVNGNIITVGYDKYGYNYQAHSFNGLYENFSRPAVVVTEGTENLGMKWSDSWLSNLDCNNDSKFDRGLNPKTGVTTGTSAGWLTNHLEGDYLGSDGEFHHYTYLAKIVYDGGAACSADDDSCLWGMYTIAEELQNDKFGEYGGRKKFINKLTGPGLGHY